MAAPRKPTEQKMPRRAPATTPTARENQLIAKSLDLVERQIEAGTASAQVLSHYIKLASTRERLEQRKIELENELLVAKVEVLASTARTEELYKDAMKSMSIYRGEEEEDDDGY